MSLYDKEGKIKEKIFLWNQRSILEQQIFPENIIKTLL